MKYSFSPSRPSWRKIGVAVAGGTVVLLGAVMLVTPGPGVAAIAAGLGILSAEYDWAKRLLAWLRRRLRLKKPSR